MKKTRRRLRKARVFMALIILVAFVYAIFKGISFFTGKFITKISREDNLQVNIDQVIEKDQEVTNLLFKKKNDNLPDLEEKKEPEPVKEDRLSVIAVGDILYHLDMIWEGYNRESGTFNYDSHFAKVKDEISSYDLALCNMEGTLSGDLAEYQAYPLFNAPDEVAKALKDAGFDIASNANNHCLDIGIPGLIRTKNVLEENGLLAYGTKRTPEEDSLLIVEKNGFKIGLLAYSQWFNGLEQGLREEEFFHISPMNEETIHKDITRAKNDMACDLVFIYPHWGEEYQTEKNAYQEDLARKMLEWGADVVFGSHPHVPQKAEIINIDGKDKFVIYSMGNYISHQRESQNGNLFTEIGAMVKLNFIKDDKGVRLENHQISPSWVNYYHDENYNWHFEVLNTDDFVENGKYFGSLSEEIYSRLLQMREAGNRVLKGENTN